MYDFTYWARHEWSFYSYDHYQGVLSEQVRKQYDWLFQCYRKLSPISYLPFTLLAVQRLDYLLTPRYTTPLPTRATKITFSFLDKNLTKHDPYRKFALLLMFLLRIALVLAGWWADRRIDYLPSDTRYPEGPSLISYHGPDANYELRWWD